MKLKEGLTKESVQYADALLKGNDWSDPDVSSEHLVEVSDSEDNCEDEDHPMMASKWKMDRRRTMRKKLKPNKNEFVGWGSTELLKFLACLGKETKEPLEKFDVYEIVKGYILSKGLLHHDKRGRKYVNSDSTLHNLVRRRRFKLSRLYTLLERHFSSSDGSIDEFSTSEEDVYARSRKRKGTSRCDSNVTRDSKIRCDSKVRCDSRVKLDRYLHNEPLLEPPKSCFAEISKDTIKAVYLKRSLIVELLKDPTTFESKVIGCFVRFKVDPKGFNGIPWKLYQLGQVTGYETLFIGLL